MINCDFSVPIDLGNASTSDWEFSQMNCTSTLFEQISNSTSGAEFFISKTLTYGDVVVFWFLTIFLVAGILTFIFKTFWHK